jgi:quinol monooxygenase YgiN
MQTVSIVLNVGTEHVAAFEQGFREQEAPIWRDLQARGTIAMATISRLDHISTSPVAGAQQYLVTVIFADDEGHDQHDSDPRFEAWNRQADTYQVQEPFVFGGQTILSVGP